MLYSKVDIINILEEDIKKIKSDFDHGYALGMVHAYFIAEKLNRDEQEFYSNKILDSIHNAKRIKNMASED